jgi:hypothetical protein
LDKLLTAPLTETGMLNKILKEILILGYRSSMLNFFMKFKIFSGVEFLNFFTKLLKLINSTHIGGPSISASEPMVRAN